jgi:hypothetical protein
MPGSGIWNSSGNVGIGLTSPSAKLDVTGTVKIADGTQALGRVFTSDANGLGSWQAIPNDNDWTFRVTDTADTTLQMGGRWGLARSGNTLIGNADSTHVNLGVASTTGRVAWNSKYCTVAGGYNNTAGIDYSTVGGGSNNNAGNWCASIGGGNANSASGWWSSIGGGSNNTATAERAAVGGGMQNNATDTCVFIGGGRQNNAAGEYSAILGGRGNNITASGSYAYLFGIGSSLTQDSTFMVDLPHVWFGTEAGGYEFPYGRGASGQIMVTDGSGKLSWGSNADNDWTFRVTDGADTILQTIGRWGITRAGNTLYGNCDSTHVNLGYSSVTGRSGEDNRFSTVSGGAFNTASRDRATVGGGWYNTAGNYEATVGGGSNNNAGGNQSTISGGAYNVATDDGGTIGGGYGNTAASGTGFYSVVGGGQFNAAGGYEATIGGGEHNTASGNFYATVGGGYYNTASGDRSTVAGGVENQAAGDYSAILGGYADTIAATGDYSYLFGINSNLTQDSTFMVDLPHIRFGKESGGYEFPTADGSSGQALVTNGSGQVSWGAPATHAAYTPTGSADANGNVGDIAWDDGYVYVKTSAGWKRSALSSW